MWGNPRMYVLPELGNCCSGNCWYVELWAQYWQIFQFFKRNWKSNVHIQCLIFKTLRRAGVVSNDGSENGIVWTEIDISRVLSFCRYNGKISQNSKSTLLGLWKVGKAFQQPSECLVKKEGTLGRVENYCSIFTCLCSQLFNSATVFKIVVHVHSVEP